MASSFVQGTSNIDFSVTSVSATINGVAAGNAIGFFVGWLSTTVTLDSVTGATFTVQDNPSGISSHGRVAQGYAENVTSGNKTITANFSGAVTAEIHIFEIAGIPTSTSQDDHKFNYQLNPGTGTDVVTSTAATVSAGGIILGASFDPNNASSPSSGTGFTSISAGSFGRSEYKLIVTGGTQAVTFTETEATSDNGTLAMAFKSADSGPGAGSDVSTVGVSESSSNLIRVTVPEETA